MAIETDVVIIGAGPVGLFQVFELGLQGIKAHVLDTLPHAGGQCVELYPDKPIYDIPAVPVCTGVELVERLLQQVEPFAPNFHFENEVTDLQRREDGLFTVCTSQGLEFNCRAVVIAAGGGSFTPVRIRVDGLSRFEESQLFYRVTNPEQHKDKHLIILGGGDSALDWALALQADAKSLTVLNRTERFRGAAASLEKLEALEKEGKVSIKLGTVNGFAEQSGALSSVQVMLRDADKTQIELPVDHLLVFFGMSPKLGAIENWGLEFDRKLIAINPETFETNLPGVYAIGDISTYVGKRKLILSGFHEAAMTAYAIKSRFEPDKKINVQYTTTSSVMQERLGIQ